MSEDPPVYHAPGFSVSNEAGDDVVSTKQPSSGFFTGALIHQVKASIPLEVRVLDPRFQKYYLEGFEKATPESTAFDLRYIEDEPIKLHPNRTHRFNTGLAIWVAHPDYSGIIIPRSGLGTKHQIVLANGTGLIDPDYQGELRVTLVNQHEYETYTIEPGEKIAQFFVVHTPQFHLKQVTEFSDTTQRGTGGFGSSGRF